MRARSLFPVTVFTVLSTLTGCTNSPTGIPETGHPALLVVAPRAATIKGGATLQLNLSAHDEGGQPAAPTDVTWTTSNQQVATIAAGVVTGRGPGSAQITAWWNGVHGVSLVTVVDSGSGSPRGCGGGPEKSKALLLKVCLEQ